MSNPRTLALHEPQPQIATASRAWIAATRTWFASDGGRQGDPAMLFDLVGWNKLAAGLIGVDLRLASAALTRGPAPRPSWLTRWPFYPLAARAWAAMLRRVALAEANSRGRATACQDRRVAFLGESVSLRT